MKTKTKVAIGIASVIGIAISIVVAIEVLLYLGSLGTFGSQFEIVSHNADLGIEFPSGYNYTILAKIKHNSGTTDSIIIYCELTREDLTTITKSETVTLTIGQEKIVSFFFSNEDLKGQIPHQYRIYGDFE